MNAVAPPRFWERPIEPTIPVDLAALPVYRASQFPAGAGPSPWLDGPDAAAQIDQRLAAGELSAEEAELCRKWTRDGYLILEGFYSDDLLDAGWSAYEAAIASGQITPPDEPFHADDVVPGRMANVHFHVPA